MQVYTYPEAQNYILYNTFEHPVIALNLYGNSVQDGTPTPDAPIDIVNVGDDGAVEVVSHGKNMFDFDAWKSGISTIVNGTIEYFDGGFKLTATAADCYTGPANGTNCDIPVKPNTTYALSWASDNLNEGAIYVFLNGKIDGSQSVSYNQWPSKRVRFTTKSDTTYVRVRFGVTRNGQSVAYRDIQLEKADEKTDYVPFKGYEMATIISGLPLCSVGDVRDKLVYNADGTGKIVKRTAKLDSYNGETVSTDYISSTGGLDTGAEVVYVLENPLEIELSEAEITALMKLQTFEGTTYIYNFENAEMKITFLGGNEMQTNIDGFWDSEDGDKKYSAADFVGFFQDFFTNGIVAESTTYLQVLKKSGFEVAVNVGKAYINGCFFKPKTITTLALEVNDGTADRTDLIVIRWDKLLRQIYLAVKKGTTRLTRNELVYELGIAKIAVKANATEIKQSDIADLRFDNAYCGVVTGVIDTIDTTNLFAQYEAEWNNFVAQLGESDHVTISVADEQARADLAEYIAKTDAILATNAPFKILKGTTSAPTVTFSEPFSATPTVVCTVRSSSTTVDFLTSCHITEVDSSRFKVSTRQVTNNGPDTYNATVHWVAFGT